MQPHLTPRMPHPGRLWVPLLRAAAAKRLCAAVQCLVALHAVQHPVRPAVQTTCAQGGRGWCTQKCGEPAIVDAWKSDQACTCTLFIATHCAPKAARLAGFARSTALEKCLRMSARSAGTAICDVHVEARRMHDVLKQNLPYIYLFPFCLFVRRACSAQKSGSTSICRTPRHALEEGQQCGSVIQCSILQNQAKAGHLPSMRWLIKAKRVASQLVDPSGHVFDSLCSTDCC